MSEPTPRTWTVDECIDAMEHSGIITNAFTLEERELARNIATAWHFIWYQQELPGRYLEEKNGVDTAEFSSLQAGIMRVRQQRRDRALSQIFVWRRCEES